VGLCSFENGLRLGGCVAWESFKAWAPPGSSTRAKLVKPTRCLPTAGTRRGCRRGPDGPGHSRRVLKRFVDSPSDADIPFVWEAEPSGNWYVAHCVYEPSTTGNRLDVSRILVTTHYQGQEVPLDELYRTVLHEMGHALGLAGHSPSPTDIMYFRGTRASEAEGLSARDRATLRALYAKPNGYHLAGAKHTD